MNTSERDEIYMGLLLLIVLRFPRARITDIHRHWYLSVITREYPEPSYGELQQWVGTIKQTL